MKTAEELKQIADSENDIENKKKRIDKRLIDFLSECEWAAEGGRYSEQKIFNTNEFPEDLIIEAAKKYAVKYNFKFQLKQEINSSPYFYVVYSWGDENVKD